MVQNKPLEKDVTDQTTPSPKPVFDNDYKLTDEDIEVAAFLRQSYEDVDVVDVGEMVLKVHHLKQNVIKKFIFDEVCLLHCDRGFCRLFMHMPTLVI
jgi:sulfur relay (sulfurtransferase) DsrC/TusE family protein